MLFTNPCQWIYSLCPPTVSEFVFHVFLGIEVKAVYLQSLVTACTGSGWDGVTFLHSSSYGAVF